MDELNVKEVAFYADEASFVSLKVKPNFRTLGNRVGPLMKQVKELIENLDTKRVETLFRGESITLSIGGEEVLITAEDILVDRQVKEGVIAATENGITIALDTALNEELLIEGLAREIVNKINTQRRTEEFEVTDRIILTAETTPRVREAFEKHLAYISDEVLLTKLIFEKTDGTEWDLNGERAVFSIIKN